MKFCQTVLNLYYYVDRKPDVQAGILQMEKVFFSSFFSRLLWCRNRNVNVDVFFFVFSDFEMLRCRSSLSIY